MRCRSYYCVYNKEFECGLDVIAIDEDHNCAFYRYPVFPKEVDVLLKKMDLKVHKADDTYLKEVFGSKKFKPVKEGEHK